jgi:hypothetical protein
MTEADFWGRIRKKLPRRVFARRIEDNSGNLGTFDTFVGLNGRSAWMELKVAGPNAKPDLRPGQPSFAAQCFDAGIPAAYVIGSSDGSVRMVGPHTIGSDWRDHLICRWSALDVPALIRTLMAQGGDMHGWQPKPLAVDPVHLRSSACAAR